ncbi:tRNA (cytidine(34)-2'-O)-methyltransferase [Blastomonas sp.]|uniref:tRNA (cytidine(34)-2'-O)-methyltransferase n=1 Tax=Blastomonas sp. TaxID=1909299 RepID=UPI003594123B
MRIALYQPDIAGNVGTILRLAACMAVPVDLIEPCGFAFDDRRLKRAAMDYGPRADLQRHAGWVDFNAFRQSLGARLVLVTAHSRQTIYQTRFATGDILLMGSESAGVPQHVRDACDLAVTIPMAPGYRSLNVSVATGIALGEALRQTRFDKT